MVMQRKGRSGTSIDGKPPLHNPFITPNELRRIVHLHKFPVQRAQADVFPKVPIIRGVAVSSKTYTTADEAARAAEVQALGLTAADLRVSRHEYGGWILRTRSGRYAFSVPITFGAEGSFYPLNEVVPQGYRGVATYHTHPHVTRYEGQGFSDQSGDAGFQDREDLIGYVADTYSRNLYRFTPGVTVEGELGSRIGDFVVHLH